MIEYHQYTAKDVRAWLDKDVNNGLSENIISRTRANALAHCPCVKDDDILVVSAKDGEKVVGFTAIFPEKLERPDRWIATGTTLLVNSDYADEFVGYNLVQRLWQSYPDYAVIGSEVSPAAAVIDKLLGATILKYERKAFVFRRNIEVHSLRNVASLLLEPFRKCRQSKAIKQVLASIPTKISVRARETIDAETYAFIKAHSTNDTFLRSREMLNWFLRYPFSVENPMIDRAKKSMSFSDQIAKFRNHLLQIYAEDMLVGVVLLAERNSTMHVKMLYSDDVHQEAVFGLIVKALLSSGAEQLYSLYPQLNAYLESHQVALRTNNAELLFTYPISLKSITPFVLQGADGDMFA